MAHEIVEEPIAGERAFQEDGFAANQSRAAILLLLGRQGRAMRVSAADRVAESPTEPEWLAEGRSLQVPILRATGDLVPRSQAQAELRRILGKERAGSSAGRLTGDRLASLFGRLRADPSRSNASLLFEAALWHADMLTRVCAACSYAGLGKPVESLLSVLREGVASEDSLVRSISAVALSQFAPRSRVLKPHRGIPSALEGAVSEARALLVHGTWARQEPWWQPGGDFHSHVRQHVRGGLYSSNDRFEWSGLYSHAERTRAADDLSAWVASRSLSGLDVLGHSHGANVAMLATKRGLMAGTLVLLSCPVHESKYLPDFKRAARVVSLQVRLDLVILLDGGGQSFHSPQVEEYKLPIWFKHPATHDPAVWTSYDVKRLLKL